MLFGPRELFLIAALVLMAGLMWWSHRVQQNAYKKRLADSKAQAEEIIARSEKSTLESNELLRQVLSELKAIRIALENK